MGKKEVKPRGKSKPRGAMSPYAIFTKKCRLDHKKKHPHHFEFVEFSKRCSQKWRALTEKEKKRFTALAQKDRSRKGVSGGKRKRSASAGSNNKKIKYAK